MEHHHNNPLGQQPLDSVQGGGPGPSHQGGFVFRLRGLPFEADAAQVRTFCQPFKVLEVLLCKREGRPSGDGYVVLPASTDPDACLTQLNHRFIGSRYIEVFESTEADLQAAKHLASDGLLPGHIVRLRGLPYAAREGDVRTFLTGAGVRLADVPNSIVIAQTAEGAPLGEAFAQLAEAADVGLALTRHKEVLGGRYIEVFASSRVKLFHAFQQTQINTRPRNKRRKAPAPRPASTERGQQQQQQQPPTGHSSATVPPGLMPPAASSAGAPLLHSVLQQLPPGAMAGPQQQRQPPFGGVARPLQQRHPLVVFAPPLTAAACPGQTVYACGSSSGSLRAASSSGCLGMHAMPATGSFWPSASTPYATPCSQPQAAWQLAVVPPVQQQQAMGASAVGLPQVLAPVNPPPLLQQCDTEPETWQPHLSHT